jgi:hypothetical protein
MSLLGEIERRIMTGQEIALRAERAAEVESRLQNAPPALQDAQGKAAGRRGNVQAVRPAQIQGRKKRRVARPYKDHDQRLPPGPSALTRKRGKCARAKVKIFAFLCSPARYGGYHSRWFPARQVAIAAGVPYNTASTQLSWWTACGYLSRRRGEGAWGAVWEYAAREKAARWLKLAQRDLPAYQRFLRELGVWSEYLAKNHEFVGAMMNEPFKEFEFDLKNEIRCVLGAD